MMTTHGHGRYEVRCDGCLRAPVAGGTIRTWDDRAAVLDELIGPAHGWAWIDGRLRCRRCVRSAGCLASGGHSFGNWQPSTAGLAVRTCRACGLDEHGPGYVADRAGHARAS